MNETEILNFIDSLEVPCEECNGSGFIENSNPYAGPRGWHCNDCDGTGCKLTDEGIKLFGVVRRIFKRIRAHERL